MKTHSALVLLLAFTLNPLAGWALTDDFGSNWQPRPLVDTAAPTIKPPEPRETAAPVVRPDAEAMLKPVEPFIQDVEARLFIRSQAGNSLVTRLNHLQTILFGDAKYQDAGQLLAKLAELFPQEAAKAHAALTAQAQSALPKPATANSAVVEKHPTVRQAPPQPMTAYPPQTTAIRQPASQSTKKKRSFWKTDDGWDDFENDSFFNDRPDSSSAGESGLKSLGSGIAGLAMLAGSVAGNLYLNKKLGNSNPLYPNNQYYPNGAYPYGYPAPYGAYASGAYAPYGNIYPYGQPPVAYNPYGQPVYAPYGQPFLQNGQNRTGTTFRSTSLLGVPTGLMPY